MNSPNELIAHPDVVAPDLRAATGEEAISSLHARLCAASPAVKDAAELLRVLLERTRLASVCIASEIAVPHARTDAVERMVLAVGRTSTDGIFFNAEHPQVRLVFLVGTPRDQVGEYLQLVAALARLLKTEGVRAGLLAAKTEAELRAWLATAVKSKA